MNNNRDFRSAEFFDENWFPLKISLDLFSNTSFFFIVNEE